MRIGFTFDSASFVIGKKSTDLTRITLSTSAFVLISDLHLNFVLFLRFFQIAQELRLWECVKNQFKILMEPTQVRIPGITQTQAVLLLFPISDRLSHK